MGPLLTIKITRKHSSRMRTARLLTVGDVQWGVCPGGCPRSYACPAEVCPGGPGEVCPGAEADSPPHCGQNTCENITLPQTSFASGNKHCFTKMSKSSQHGIRQILAHGIGGSKGGARDAPPPPGVQILSISCSFGGKNGQIIASFRVGAPSSGKSWIRHCMVTCTDTNHNANNYELQVISG